MSTTETPTSVTLPPGKYVVGDPCYVIPDARWMEWLEAADYMTSCDFLVASLDGHVAVGVGTKYGDGSYYDGLGNEFGVDAGLIGLVPVEIADMDRVGGPKVILNVGRPMEVFPADEDGVITLGPHVIPTGDPEEDECSSCGSPIDLGYGDVCSDCEYEECDDCGADITFESWHECEGDDDEDQD